MLTISPLRSNKDESNQNGGTTTKMEANFCLTTNDDFPDFSGSNLLDSIDFDDLFMGIHNTDGLPNLEMDPELLAEFSLSGEEDSSTMSIENIVSPNSFFDGNIAYVLDGHESRNNNNSNNDNNVDDVDNNGVYGALKLEKDDLIGKNNVLEDVEIQSKKTGLGSESVTTLNSSLIIGKEKVHKKHKSSSNSKVDSTNKSNNNNDNSSNQGKRKTKVDWTPELHRRFVQAVEQLGVDKAVPSRILELMGIDCLTRHNIASHLQKYRSHRKHLLAREAEAASWTQKRQMYGVVVSGGPKGGASISPWPHPPTIGFPPMTTMHHRFRPLHVWGHPSMDPQARMPMWPKQVAPPTAAPLPLPWAAHPPPGDPAFWHPSHHRRLAVPPVPPVHVPGIPPHAVYRPEHSAPAPPSGSTITLDPHPSKETVDAALGDVLSKPWLPLPIGLKPPSMDSVFGELQRQGISKIPPSSTSS
ncbi:hypothetical protein vseg_018258 [Gypsophila vaccaria]